MLLADGQAESIRTKTLLGTNAVLPKPLEP